MPNKDEKLAPLQVGKGSLGFILGYPLPTLLEGESRILREFASLKRKKRECLTDAISNAMFPMVVVYAFLATLLGFGKIGLPFSVNAPEDAALVLLLPMVSSFLLWGFFFLALWCFHYRAKMIVLRSRLSAFDPQTLSLAARQLKNRERALASAAERLREAEKHLAAYRDELQGTLPDSGSVERFLIDRKHSRA